MRKLTFVTTLGMAILPALAGAQTSDPFWRSWQALDDITEARAAGLGGAVAALADDASTTRYNPAGLTRLPRHEVAASLVRRGAATRPSGDSLAAGPSLGSVAGALTLSPRWAVGGYLAQSTRQHIALGSSGSLAMDSTDGGVAVAWHPANRVHLGARLTVRHLRLSGAVTDGSLTIGTAAGTDEIGGDAGVLVEITPDLHAAVAYRQGVRWSDVERTAVDGHGTVDPGSLHQLAVPTVTSAGIAWRPSPRWAIGVQLDHVALGEVHDTLGAAQPADFVLEDALEPRAGVEYSHPAGSLTVQVRGGLHYRASRSFAYVGSDPQLRAGWPGDGRAVVGSGGLSLVTRGGHRVDLAVTGGGGRTALVAGAAARF